MIYIGKLFEEKTQNKSSSGTYWRFKFVAQNILIPSMFSM